MGCAGSKGADASGAKPKDKKADEGEKQAEGTEEQPVSTDCSLCCLHNRIFRQPTAYWTI